MNELFYFAFADLMARVEYNKKANSLGYASHRGIAAHERLIVERYLLANVATKTDYFERHPSRFVYLGVEARLARHLDLFHRKNTLAKEKEIAASVEGLIKQSMQNFYFEQIGDVILALRQELSNEGARSKVAPLRRKMDELVKAYNLYSEQSINIAEVLPAELKSHLDLSTPPRTGRQAFADSVFD